MEKISSFIIENSNDFRRNNEPVTIAAPFPKGLITENDNLTIIENGKNNSINSNSLITGKWNDNSIKWINFEILANLDENEIKNYDIIKQSNSSDKNNESFFMPEKNKDIVGKIKFKENEQTLGIRCISKDNKAISFNHKSCSEIINTNFKKVTQLLFNAELSNLSIELLIRIHEYKDSKTIKIESLIKNLNAAHHLGDFWDLGDAGSLFFRELSLVLTDPEKNDSTFTIDSSSPKDNSYSSTDINLVQQSSGGKMWDCRTHIAADEKNYRKIKGAIIEKADEKSEESRISPTIFTKNKNEIQGITLAEFWQNFPSALIKKEKSVYIGLFPNYCEELYELQGGEQKKQTIWIKQFESPENANMQWVHDPLIPIFSAEWHEKCKIYPYMTTPDENDPKEYFDLIDNCINEENSFYKRREGIDEYGWRNYGELYADHESSYLENGEYHVSHYNNQYDFANYAMVQFWRSSNKKWYFLAEQLARHIRDIDTYHTEMDQFAYNGGIFWHTNHYVSAGLATHRCYSKKANPPSIGGLSIQNCYIAGLMTHYYTSGDQDTYNSIIETLNYAYKLVMGPGDLKGNLKYFAKETIKNFYYGMKSKITKEVYPYGIFQGPGRESGNGLLILTKAFEFTKDKRYLKAAAKLMKRCIGPNQNLKAMRMAEPEYRWMYLLFLQSLIEFIKVKEEINEKDSDYKYAIKSFNYYTEWMLENEFSYLDKPEILEYPNETWAMQELRKPHILYEAAERASNGDIKSKYITLANDLYDKAFKHFNEYGERRFLTRPLVLAVAYGLVPIFFKRKFNTN